MSSETRGKSVLYLSYDGMTDPLGRSQVLPYLIGLAARGHRITLVSFEKPQRAAEVDSVREITRGAGIDWRPQRYHKKPPVLSTVYDLAHMRRTALRLYRQKAFEIVHCRSTFTAIVGEAVQRKGARMLYDLRGFLAHERAEAGVWNVRHPVYRAVYSYFAEREDTLTRKADHVVTLTRAAKRILEARPGGAAPITVIPCCVDFELFTPVASDQREASRTALGLNTERKVITYLGSVGTWYLLEEMLDFFRIFRMRHRDALFLIITPDPAEQIEAAAERRDLPRDSLMIRSAKREQVPLLLSAANYSIFFIKPVFSKQASSPTKMGELLAMGIPFITNSGVGDVGSLIKEIGGGVALKAFDTQSYSDAMDRLEALPALSQELVRDRARLHLDLAVAIERYDAIYRSLGVA